ncbi:hypothetical protein Tco_1191905 [Tanacetum coccineum]
MDIYTNKGPLNVTIYGNDNSSENITEFKVLDLHVIEWKEVMDCCGKRKEDKIPFKEQNPILEMNKLAKKRKRESCELQEFFRSTKHFKKFSKYDKVLIGTILNEPTLRMIYFNDPHRPNFVSVKELPNMPNETIFNV